TLAISPTKPDGTPAVICAKCHDLNGPTGSWSNSVHQNHQGSSRGRCAYCHIKIPHGWKRPRLLVDVDSDGIYSGSTSGVTAIAATSTTPANWRREYCQTNCASQHSTAPASWWP
ncbi:MAG: NapC/NirT family cytochrome c, partial [Coriobacteriia bacterium]|nr:NapC/NirT family cytochrome c [Coriobacteriia bacterium]